jgi:hypothetical protein
MSGTVGAAGIGPARLDLNPPSLVQLATDALLAVIEGGDPQAVLAELAVHGERSFCEPATTK